MLESFPAVAKLFSGKFNFIIFVIPSSFFNVKIFLMSLFLSKNKSNFFLFSSLFEFWFEICFKISLKFNVFFSFINFISEIEFLILNFSSFDVK